MLDPLARLLAFSKELVYASGTATGAAQLRKHTMTVLRPSPVSIRQFAFSKVSNSFVAEMSSTNGLGRVYPDSCDEGLTVIGNTGREVVFVVEDVSRDGDGDLTSWTLRSIGGQFTMTLFND